MAGLIGDLTDAASRGVSVYSPTRRIVRPTGTVANAGTARRITSQGGSDPLSIALSMQAGNAQAREDAWNELPTWKRALGTAANSVPGQVVTNVLNAVDIPRRVVISGLTELGEAASGNQLTGEGASWDDFISQVRDPNFGFGTVAPQTGSRWLDRTIGFVGDVALDPTTYLGGSGLVTGTGRAARTGLAARMIEAGLGEELATRVARFGITDLDNIERQAVREAIGTTERGLLRGGEEQLVDRGMYFKAPGMTEHVRLPFTAGIDTALGRVGSRVRSTVGSSSIYNALFGRTGNNIERAARQRLASGIGDMSFGEAAEILNVIQTKRWGERVSRRTAEAGWAALRGRFGDDALQAMVNEAETVGGTEINRFFARLREQLLDMGVKHGFIDNYVPHFYTEQGRAWVKGVDPDASAFRKALDEKGLIEDFSPSTMERHILGRPEPYHINGKDFHFRTGTIAEMNSEFRRVTGLDFDLVEGDVHKIMSRYIGGYGGDIGAAAVMERLRKSRSGLTAERADLLESISETVSNAAMRKQIKAEVAAAKAAQVQLSTEFGTNLVGATQALMSRFQPVIDDLVSLSETERKRLGELATSRANLSVEADELVDELDTTTRRLQGEYDQLTTDIAELERQARQEETEFFPQARRAALEQERVGPKGRQRRLKAREQLARALQRQQRLAADLEKLERLTSAHAALVQAETTARRIADESSFAATILPHEVPPEVQALRNGPAPVADRPLSEMTAEEAEDAADAFTIDTPGKAYDLAAAKRQRLVPTLDALPRWAQAETDLGPIVEAMNETMGRINAAAATAARERENLHSVASALNGQLTSANQHLDAMRRVEASTQAFMELLEGHPEHIDRHAEVTLWLEGFRASDGQLGRAIETYGGLRTQLDEAATRAAEAESELRRLEDELHSQAQAYDAEVDRWRRLNPAEPEVALPLPFSRAERDVKRQQLADLDADIRNWDTGVGGKRERALRREIGSETDEIGTLTAQIRTLENALKQATAGETLPYALDAKGNVVLSRRGADTEATLRRRDELIPRVEALRSDYQRKVVDIDALTDPKDRVKAVKIAERAYYAWKEASDELVAANQRLLNQGVASRGKGGKIVVESTMPSARLSQLRKASSDLIKLRASHDLKMGELAGLLSGRRITGNRQQAELLRGELAGFESAAKAARAVERRNLASGAEPSALARKLNMVTTQQHQMIEVLRPPVGYKLDWEDVPAKVVDVDDLIPFTPSEQAAYEQAQSVLRDVSLFGGEDAPIVRQANAIIDELRTRIPIDSEGAIAHDAFTDTRRMIEALRDAQTPWRPETPEQLARIEAPTQLRQRGGNVRQARRARSARARRATLDNALSRAKRAQRFHERLQRFGILTELADRGAITPRLTAYMQELATTLDKLVKARALDAMPYANRRIEQATVDLNRAMEYAIRYRRALEQGITPSPKVAAFVASVVLENESKVLGDTIARLRRRLGYRTSRRGAGAKPWRKLSSIESDLLRRMEAGELAVDERFMEAIARDRDGKVLGIRGFAREETDAASRIAQLRQSIHNDEEFVRQALESHGSNMPPELRGKVKLARKRAARNQRKLAPLEVVASSSSVDETIDAMMTMVHHQIVAVDQNVSALNFWRNLTNDRAKHIHNLRQLRVTNPRMAADIESYGAEATRLLNAIARAERTGSDVVRWIPSGYVSYDMPSSEALRAIDAGELPQGLRLGIEQQAERGQAVSPVEVYRGEAVERWQERIARERQMTRQEYVQMYRDRAADRQAAPGALPDNGIDRLPLRYDEGFAAGQTGAPAGATRDELLDYTPMVPTRGGRRARDVRVKGRYVSPMDRSNMQTLPIADARARLEEMQGNIAYFRDRLTRNQVIERLMDNTLHGDEPLLDVVNPRGRPMTYGQYAQSLTAAVEAAESGLDVAAIRIEADRMLQEVFANGRQLTTEEMRQVQRAQRLVESWLGRDRVELTPEQVEQAKAYLGDAREIIDSDEYLQERAGSYFGSVGDNGEAFFRELFSGRSQVTAEEADFIGGLLGSGEGKVAQQMARRFTELMGGVSIRPIDRADIVQIGSMLGNPNYIEHMPALQRLLEGGASDVTEAEVDDAIESVRRFAGQAMRAGAPQEYVNHLTEWSAHLRQLRSGTTRQVVATAADHSPTEIARLLEQFISEFGESNLADALRRQLSYADDAMLAGREVEPREIVDAMREELVKSMTSAARSEAIYEQTEAMVIARALGLSLGADDSMSGRLSSLGYNLSREEYDPQRLRTTIVRSLTDRDVIGDDVISSRIESELRQTTVLKARVDQQRRGLGRQVGYGSPWIAGDTNSDAMYERMARAGMGKDEEEAFDARLAALAEISPPDEIGQLVNNELARLQAIADDPKASAEARRAATASIETVNAGQIPELPPAFLSLPSQTSNLTAVEVVGMRTELKEIAERRAEISAREVEDAADIPPLERHPDTPTGMYSVAEYYEALRKQAAADAAGNHDEAMHWDRIAHGGDGEPGIMDQLWGKKEPEESRQAALELSARHSAALRGEANESVAAELATLAAREAELTNELQAYEAAQAVVPGEVEQLVGAPAAPTSPLEGLRPYVGTDTDAADISALDQQIEAIQQLVASGPEGVSSEQLATLASRVQQLTAQRNSKLEQARRALLAERSGPMRASMEAEAAAVEGPRARLDPEHLMTTGGASRWYNETPVGLERMAGRADDLGAANLRTGPTRGRMTAGTLAGQVERLEATLAPALSLRQEARAARERNAALAAQAQRRIDALNPDELVDKARAHDERVVKLEAATREHPYVARARAQHTAEMDKLTEAIEMAKRQRQHAHETKVKEIADVNLMLWDIDEQSAALNDELLNVAETHRATQAKLNAVIDALDFNDPKRTPMQNIDDLRRLNFERLRIAKSMNQPGIANDPTGTQLANYQDITRIEQMLLSGYQKAYELERAGDNTAALQARFQEFADDPSKVGSKLVEMVRQGWLPLTNTAIDADDALYVTAGLHRAINQVNESFLDPETWKMFDTFTSFFRTYATATPGFHLRNFVSGMFMNFVDGVRARDMNEARQIWSSFMKDPFGYIERSKAQARAAGRTQSREAMAIEAVFASGAAGQFTEVGEGLSHVTAKVMNNRLTRWNQRKGADVEGILRLGMALNSMDRGMSVAGATERIVRTHFDYANLGNFDRTMRRLVPFWTFMSRNVPLQLESMLLRPRTYQKYDSFVRNFGADVDPLTPDYWLNQGAFTFTEGQGDGQEGSSWYFAPDLPHTRLLEPLEGGWRNVMSNLNPALLVPMEALGFKEKLYSGADLEGASKPEGTMALFAPIFEALGLAEEGGTSGDTLISNSFQHAVRTLLPTFGLSERLTAGLTETDDTSIRTGREGETWLRALGAPVLRLTPQMRDQTARSRYYDALDAQDKLMELARS